jgi:hypothetical protein
VTRLMLGPQHSTLNSSWLGILIQDGLNILGSIKILCFNWLWIETSNAKKCTCYKCVVPIGIHVACSFCKFFHGVKYFQCSGMFAPGKSTIHLVLWEFVYVINVVCRIQIRWFKGEVLVKVVAGFRTCVVYHMSMVLLISHKYTFKKPRGPFVGDYFSFNSKGFNMHLEVVVDH